MVIRRKLARGVIKLTLHVACWAVARPGDDSGKVEPGHNDKHSPGRYHVRVPLCCQVRSALVPVNARKKHKGRALRPASDYMDPDLMVGALEVLDVCLIRKKKKWNS